MGLPLHIIHISFVPRLAEADVVLTTYTIIGREVGVPEEMKKDKTAQEMPVTDAEVNTKMYIRYLGQSLQH